MRRTVPLKLGSGGQPGTMALPGANGKIGLPVSTTRRTFQIDCNEGGISGSKTRMHAAAAAGARPRGGTRTLKGIAPNKARSLVANPQARKRTPACTHLNSCSVRQRRAATSEQRMKNGLRHRSSARIRPNAGPAAKPPAPRQSRLRSASAPQSRARIQAASSVNAKNKGAINWAAVCPPSDQAKAKSDSAACGKNE